MPTQPLRTTHLVLSTVLLFIFCAFPSSAHAQLTLETIMSAPFPTNLTASPSGERVAWVFNDEGVRNIWIAEAPEFEGRPLTSYADEDGQDISNLVFTPDEEHIVFMRGGAPNRRGEFPNPRSFPELEGRGIHIVSWASGDVRRLPSGGSPALSPDGSQLVFTRGNNVRHVSLADSAESEALFSARGSLNQLRWSPDGNKLAFRSGRGTHGFIGIYDLEAETITWLDPSLDNDFQPVWSPDGTQVAFMREPRERDILPFMPRREGLPWSIRIADAETGQGRAVWTADEGPGSVLRAISASSQLMWGAEDRLVFPWEKEGWTHLYSVPTSGGEATLLTPGPFEVQFVSMGRDGSTVYYSSNQGDIDRQHVWQVPVTGGTPKAITSGTGIEWAPVELAGNRIAALASGGQTPAHPIVIEGDSRTPLSNSLEGYPTHQLVEPEQVIFTSPDGMQIHAQLFLPPNTQADDKRPAVAFFHGGSRRQMLLGFHHRGYYHNAYAFNQYLATQGYVVLSVNFRSGIGYGMHFREALNYGAMGASEFNDVTGAGLYLRSRPDVDPNRIGLWGGSYGGYLTAFGLARASSLFAAGVDIHGAHDWNVVINNFVPGYDPKDYPEFAQLAFDSSPMAHLDTWESPVLLIHGDDDRNVPFSESVDLIEDLRRRDVHVEHLVFPDEVHGFLLHSNWLAAYHAAYAFFEAHMPAE